MSLDAILQEVNQTHELTELRKFSVNGYGTSKQHRTVYRLLLNISRTNYPSHLSPSPSNPFYQQIKKDSIRSLKEIKSPELKELKRQQLVNVIVSVFDRNPDLSYTQGFHDIASLVLSFSKEPLAVLILEALALGHLRPFLSHDLGGVSSILNFIFPLLKLVDKELHRLLLINGFDSSLATSYILTYFSHNASTTEEGLRYLDFFIASHPLMPVYSLVVLLHKRRDTFINDDVDEGTIMQAFGNLLNDGINPDDVIQCSVDLFNQMPPSKLLARDKTIKISKECTFLNPENKFPYQYSNFPHLDKFPMRLYKSRIGESKPNFVIQGLFTALAVALAFRFLLE
ncbi:TBC1 domain family member 20 [Tritrichomonas foetus]|uniref:TBC1 domain family member 20 n=1 Tax=Tritrichomonas foetus TaxID=1144522 RepID=A0A1J4KE08_9EUKA|nr:TBC1 domain family member 20 [Tritrichomonas foetus]|eukprot:OHT09427.1 TBC1 domain family member 20 [Tritrichomonas foetus]